MGIQKTNAGVKHGEPYALQVAVSTGVDSIGVSMDVPHKFFMVRSSQHSHLLIDIQRTSDQQTAEEMSEDLVHCLP